MSMEIDHHTWTNEPIIHSHVTDGLPDDDPRAWESIYCVVHGGLLHSIPNECMTAWADTDSGPMCLYCLGEVLN